MTVALRACGGQACVDGEVRAAADVLKAWPGVASVKPLNRAEIAALLVPWIGSSVIDPELPLPALIDVTFDGTERGRAVQVRALLEKIAPHARVDEQTAWLQALSGLLSTLRWLGIGIALLVALAMEIGRAHV